MRTHDLNTVKRNFWYLAGPDVLNKGLLFVTTIYLGRTLGIEGFGWFTFGQTLTVFFVLGADLGTEWMGVKETARMAQRAAPAAEVNRYIVELTCCRLALGAVMAVLYLLAAKIASGAVADFRIFLPYAIYVLSTSFLIEWVFSGRQTMQHVALGRFVRSVLYCLIVLAMVHRRQDVVWAAFSYWVSFFVSELVLIWLFARKPLQVTCCGLRPWRFLWLIRSSGPIVFFVLLQQQSFYSVDIILLQLGLGPIQVGAFSAVVRIISVGLQLSVFVTSSFFPLLARLGNTAESGILSSQLAVQIFCVSVPIALFAFILSRQVLSILFGSAFAMQGGSVGFLFLTVPLTQLAIIYANALVACDKQKQTMFIVLATNFFNAALGAIAIHVGSIGGLIAVTFVSLVAANYLLIRAGRMTFPVFRIVHRMAAGLAITALAAGIVRGIIAIQALDAAPAGCLVAISGLLTMAVYLRVVYGERFWRLAHPAASN